MPTVEVDHIDGDKLNNRISNLRLCLNGSNNQNRVKSARNTSGYSGVVWDKRRELWYTRVYSNGKYKFLGYFSDPEQAREVYVAAKKVANPLYMERDT